MCIYIYSYVEIGNRPQHWVVVTCMHVCVLSCTVMSESLWPHGLWNSPGQNTRVGSLSLLQRIFPTQGSNPGLPHCRRILSQLSHKGSPRILKWVAYPFSSRSSQINWGLLHCRWILYQLNYEESPRHWQACSCGIKLPTSIAHQKSKSIPEKHLLMIYWLHQSLWRCGSQQTVENSSRDENTRPHYLSPEKSVCGSRDST